MPITLRAAGPDDAAFLFDVYASTRAEELAPVPWSNEQRQEFLRMQFDAQHSYYHERFPEADYQVILADGEAVGASMPHATGKQFKFSISQCCRNVGAPAWERL